MTKVRLFPQKQKSWSQALAKQAKSGSKKKSLSSSFSSSSSSSSSSLAEDPGISEASGAGYVDFLLTTKNSESGKAVSLFISELPQLYVAGHGQALLKVPEPSAKNLNSAVRERMSFEIVRLFLENPVRA